ncbi:ABC transporter substrate-binding protein [Kitasatospora cheerisanensis]|uniref:Putative ABC transporter substrate-binding protein n=1 Tax=Kitasatospora cheerisanensis KCTC 2395 TaxID=1348663 RepID=A0A066Z6C8_9ACTN|nr:ABC transporter substrate-binding protein [Kitasatospora cheerisanensis]KDN85901.1 putative ABC transporter substrate-binding protein [Kitasatospora cheerisanensis KCTC 2395]
MAHTTRRGRTALVAVIGGALLLGGCGTGGSHDKKVDLHALLPEAVRKSGVLTVGASFTAAPVVYRNDRNEPDGLDPHLAEKLGEVLGIRLEFQDAGAFANVLPGLMNRQYDVAMSGITDTREREEGLDKDGKPTGPGVDFVDYFMAGIGIAVDKGNPQNVTDIDHLCGHTVVVKKGTTHDDLVQRQTKVCEHQSKPLKLVETDTDTAALDKLKGQADAFITDYPKAQYAAQTVDNGNAFQIGGPQIQPRPFGIALRKDDAALRDVLMRAMNRLITDGTYDQVLSDHNLAVGAIQNSVINGST